MFLLSFFCISKFLLLFDRLKKKKKSVIVLLYLCFDLQIKKENVFVEA